MDITRLTNTIENETCEQNLESLEEIRMENISGMNNYDIGCLSSIVTSKEVECAILHGPTKHPNLFPKDVNGKSFPKSILKCRLKNGDVINRDWLVWSKSKCALFCFPCRLFKCANNSCFTNYFGYSAEYAWKKLYCMIECLSMKVVYCIRKIIYNGIKLNVITMGLIQLWK